MTAIALLKKSEADHTDKLGTAEDIIYRQKDGTMVEAKAFVMYAEQDKDNAKTRHNEVVFSSVLLPFDPKRKESILYDGDELIVDRHNKQNGRYMIFTLSHAAWKLRRES